jgi:hypothetical protein
MENKKSQKEGVDCCGNPLKERKAKGIWQGIGYGLIPHIGCIAFIIFSVLGMTAFASVFRPLLYKAYFFYIMIGVSLVLATLSASFYLKKHGGIKEYKNHKGYLSILYGSTIGVGLLLYFIVFPLVGAATASSGTIQTQDSSFIIKVSIPCEGHAPLITDELGKLSGVNAVNYLGSYKFQVYYDSQKISQEQILSADIFKQYAAKEVAQ